MLNFHFRIWWNDATGKAFDNLKNLKKVIIKE